MNATRKRNRILSAGDRLVAELGLTSARWQVLGTITAAERPQPVAWLAGDMDAHRQNVQRIINDLAEDGLVALQPNPHHRRAQLVVLTEKGRQTYEAAMQLQIPWVNELTGGLELEDIETTPKTVAAIRTKLEGDGATEDLL